MPCCCYAEAHKPAPNTLICAALGAIPDRWAAARGWQEGARDPAYSTGLGT